MTAIDDIAAERARQLAVEGWSAEHDDAHDKGEMARAAMAYCQSASVPRDDTSVLANRPPQYWPWETRWWKPKNKRRDLVRAGALIAAEIDRLDRRRK